MSALDDILAAFRRLPAPQGSTQRLVVVGASARYSILADMLANEDGIADGRFDADLEAVLKRNLGRDIVVRETNDFHGWDIMECDAAGRFKSVAA